jgi:hypothetical protein|tara:strand:- start:1476 stop:2123 length:648 start_codon:yes stop_codon:yes gene_type:complete
MWDKIKEKSLIAFYGLSIVFAIIAMLYLPVKCTIGVVDRIQNPPSEIYAENQVFDKWKSYCIERDNEDCDVYGSRLKTKSLMFFNDDEVDIVAVIEVDEYNMQLSIKIRNWNTGDIIQPFPQEKHKWYEFYKSYDSYESTGVLLNEESEDALGYEITIFRNEIIINEDSCDSRGYEELSNIQGGCFFLEEYEKNRDEWHYLSIKFKNNKSVIINL